MLAINNLNVSYGSRKILDNLSLNVSPMETVLISGENGSGKSTFLKTIVGIKEQDTGQIVLNEKSLSRMPIYQRIQAGIKYMPQNPVLIFDETVAFNIRIARKLSLRYGQLCSVDLADDLGINAILSKNIFELSSGQIRKLEFYITTLSQGQLYILDEPFTSWDKDSIRIGLDFIYYLVKQIHASFIVVDHVNTHSYHNFLEFRLSDGCLTKVVKE